MPLSETFGRKCGCAWNLPVCTSNRSLRGKQMVWLRSASDPASSWRNVHPGDRIQRPVWDASEAAAHCRYGGLPTLWLANFTRRRGLLVGGADFLPASTALPSLEHIAPAKYVGASNFRDVQRCDGKPKPQLGAAAALEGSQERLHSAPRRGGFQVLCRLESLNFKGYRMTACWCAVAVSSHIYRSTCAAQN